MKLLLSSFLSFSLVVPPTGTLINNNIISNSLEKALIDIRDKLPGGDLGYFKSKTDARIALNSLIYASNYIVDVDDSNQYYFIVSGRESAGYTGTSKYYWHLSLVDISNILADNYYAGKYSYSQQAVTKIINKIFQTTGIDQIFLNFDLKRIEDNYGALIISGKPEYGFTGSVTWTFKTRKPDINLILLEEQPLLQNVSNQREAIIAVDKIRREYGITKGTKLGTFKNSNIIVILPEKPFWPLSRYVGSKSFFWV